MYPAKPNNTTQKAVAGIIVILAIVMLVIISNVSRAKQTSHAIITTTTTDASMTPLSTAPSSTTPVTPATPTNSSGYKDGTFSAIAQYYVPGGYESIQVNLTLKNGVVSDSSIVNSENNGQSAMYQQSFTSAYRSSVVGKNVGDIHLSYVAGASDTTKGFDDAVTKIASDAKA